jgi:hypothetical protein
MLKMINNTEDSAQATASVPDFGSMPVKQNGHAAPRHNLFGRIINAFKGRNDTSLREAIEEYIEEPQNIDLDPVALHELGLFSNILKLRDLRVVKVMVPRADIAAIDIDTSNIAASLSTKTIWMRCWAQFTLKTLWRFWRKASPSRSKI